MAAGFGEKVPVENALTALLRTAPPLTSSEASIVLRESYESTYGIFRHTKTTESLASVVLHPAEDVSANSRLYERIRRYIRSDIFKYTGMSLDEFFELPRELTDLIFRETDIVSDKESKHADEVKKQLEAARQAQGRGGR